MLVFEWEKEPNTNLLSDFTKMDFSRETSTREVFENAHTPLTSLFSLSCFFPFFDRFSKKLLEDQEEELEGKVVGITKSIIRLDNDIIIPWLTCSLLAAQYLTPRL